jgi:hypothetical protein
LALASGDNRLWVAVGGEPTGQLFSVDPRAGIVSGAIPTGWSPQYVATADERVWVSETVGDNSHSSKDPHQNLVAEVRPTDGTETAQAIPEPGEIAVGHSYVWVVSEGSNLDRLDRTSAKLVDEPIHLDGTVVHLRSNGAQIFATSLLSPTSTTASLTVLDEATGEIQRTLLSDLALGPALFEAQSTWVPVRVADGWELDELAQDGLHSFRRLPQNTDVNTFALGGGGAVWAWTTSGCVYSFDLHSGSLVGSSWSLDESRGDAIAIAASGQDAWVLDGQGVVAVRR